MIITDESLLRRSSENVSLEEIDDLIKKLEKELNYSMLMGRPGIGLAAPQIGIYKKAAIIRINNNLSINLINARIEKMYDPFMFKDEGCLSFNDSLKNTIRYKEIYVINNQVKPHSFIATGLMSVAIQHEIDHLNGILFLDRVIAKNHSILKIKPNEICICNSGKKYKKCCSLLKG